jgi:hypothetical protein
MGIKQIFNADANRCNPYRSPRGEKTRGPLAGAPAGKERLVEHIRSFGGLYLLAGLAVSNVLLAGSYESPRLHLLPTLYESPCLRALWRVTAMLFVICCFSGLVVVSFYRVRSFPRFERLGLALLFTLYAAAIDHFRPNGPVGNSGELATLVFVSFEMLSVAWALTALFVFLSGIGQGKPTTQSRSGGGGNEVEGQKRGQN